MPSSALRGVNLVGGEFSWGKVPSPKEGKDYLFVSDQDIDYLVGVGVKFARLVFSWELLQPTLKGPLSSGVGSYGERLFSRVTYLRSKGVQVLLEPHGAETPKFARWKGALVGTAACPNDAFADLWSRLATLYKGDPDGVYFGLSNEPNNMPTMQWFQAAQAAILAIRAAKATNWVVCPGNGWSNAASWGYDWYDTSGKKVSNEEGWDACIKDPLNKTMIGVHCYFDNDRSGASDNILEPFVGVTDLAKVVEWAKPRGLKVLVGEFGANPSTPTFQKYMKAFLDYIDVERNTVEGWCWWAYGPPAWWGKYHFTLCPSSNYTVPAPALSVLTGRFTPPPSGPAVFPHGTMSPPPIPPDTTKAFYFKVTADAGRDVTPGNYRVTARTRAITCGTDGTTVYEVTLENPSSVVDVEWSKLCVTWSGGITCLSPLCSAELSNGELVARPVKGGRIPARGRVTVPFAVTLTEGVNPLFAVTGLEL